MKYWEITATTPFCGCDDTTYEKFETKEEAENFGDRFAQENGLEWYDEEDGMDEEQYYSECSADVKEITKKEYEENI